MEKSLPRILVVEDEPGIAELLRFTLVGAGFDTTIATTALQAKSAVLLAPPDAILLDWMLPDSSGLSLLLEWRGAESTAELPIIMLTAKSTDEDKIRGLNCGADDYITKPFSPRELVARVHAHLRRKAPEPARSVHTLGVLSLDTERYALTVAGLPVKLDQAEFKLLRFLMTHPARVFSRAQLLDKVWGDEAFLEERTVDVHIMRLRKSLGAAADYIKTVRSVGYMLEAAENSV